MTLIPKGTKPHYAIFPEKYFVNDDPPYWTGYRPLARRSHHCVITAAFSRWSPDTCHTFMLSFCIRHVPSLPKLPPQTTRFISHIRILLRLLARRCCTAVTQLKAKSHPQGSSRHINSSLSVYENCPGGTTGPCYNVTVSLHPWNRNVYAVINN